MPTRRRKPLPKQDRVAALELLESCKGGCSEGLMRARDFTIEQQADLDRAGRRALKGTLS